MCFHTIHIFKYSHSTLLQALYQDNQFFSSVSIELYAYYIYADEDSSKFLLCIHIGYNGEPPLCVLLWNVYWLYLSYNLQNHMQYRKILFLGEFCFCDLVDQSEKDKQHHIHPPHIQEAKFFKIV